MERNATKKQTGVHKDGEMHITKEYVYSIIQHIKGISTKEKPIKYNVAQFINALGSHKGK